MSSNSVFGHYVRYGPYGYPYFGYDEISALVDIVWFGIPSLIKSFRSPKTKLFHHCPHLGMRPVHREEGGVCVKCTKLNCTKCMDYLSYTIVPKHNCYAGICNACRYDPV